MKTNDRNTKIAESMYAAAIWDGAKLFSDDETIKPKDTKEILEIVRYLLQNEARKIKY